MAEWVEITLRYRPHDRRWTAEACFTVETKRQATREWAIFNYDSRWKFIAYAKAAFFGPRHAVAYERRHRPLKEK